MTYFLCMLSLSFALFSTALALRAFRRKNLLRSHLEMLQVEGHQKDRLTFHAIRMLAMHAANGRARIEDLHSQNCEDALAWASLGFQESGFFIEAGGHDGINLSNTYFLEKLGWTGLLVEAHPDLANACRENRPGSRVVHAALGPDDGPLSCTFQMVRGGAGVDALSFSVGTPQHVARVGREGGRIEFVSVPCNSLNRLLAEMNPPAVDLLSLDVEGAEELVLSGFDLRRWKPRLLIIEDNNAGRDPAVKTLVEAAGYQRILRVECNDFYLRLNAEEKSLAVASHSHHL